MKLNIDLHDTTHSTPNTIVIFGVTDFQLDNTDQLTLFFPVNSGFDELTIHATVTAAVEESIMDSLTYGELVAESLNSNTVIIAYSSDFPQLPDIVAGLPNDLQDDVITVRPTDTYTELPL